MSKSLDVVYFKEKLSLVIRDLESYAINPADLARQLVRYARVADEHAAIDECRYSEKEIIDRVSRSTDDDPDYCAHSYEQNGFCPECGNTKTTDSVERMEIANPSDKATIDCTNLLAARIAVVILGDGKYGLIKKSGETDMPPFIFGGCDEWFEENHGMSFEEAFKATSIIDIANTLASVELVNEKTSMNNFSERAHKMAEYMLKERKE